LYISVKSLSIFSAMHCTSMSFSSGSNPCFAGRNCFLPVQLVQR
jgi:hypothetical protein